MSTADTVEAARGGSSVAALDDEPLSEKETRVLAAGQAADFAADNKSSDEAIRGPNGEEYPTARELETLRRVKGPITWVIYTVAFIELIERFAWYGTTAVCT